MTTILFFKHKPIYFQHYSYYITSNFPRKRSHSIKLCFNDYLFNEKIKKKKEKKKENNNSNEPLLQFKQILINSSAKEKFSALRDCKIFSLIFLLLKRYEKKLTICGESYFRREIFIHRLFSFIVIDVRIKIICIPRDMKIALENIFTSMLKNIWFWRID